MQSYVVVFQYKNMCICILQDDVYQSKLSQQKVTKMLQVMLH